MALIAVGPLAHARSFLFRAGAFVALALLLVVASLISPTFATPTNLLNVLRQMAITGVIGIGMTMVILTGGIDLSVGSIVALVSVLVAGFQRHGTVVVVFLGLLAGTMVGAINGGGVVIGRLQPFIMTLGMMTVTRGLAFMYSGGKPMEILLPGLDAVGSRAILSIPIPGLVFAFLLVLGGWLLTAVPFGRYLYAIGSNEEAARLSGVKVGMQLFAVYALCGLLSGVAGVLFAAQQSVGMALAGNGYELNAIAAGGLGGTSPFWGGGRVWGTGAGGALNCIPGKKKNLSRVQPLSYGLFE